MDMNQERRIMPMAARLLWPQNEDDWPAFTSQCGAHYPFHSVADGYGQAGTGESETVEGFVGLLFRYSVAWAAMWYCCAFIAWSLSRAGLLPPSTIAKENKTVLAGQAFTMQLKCVMLSAIANATLIRQWWPTVDAAFEGHPATEIGGLLFVSAEIADLVCGTIHGLLDVTYFIHHTIHIGVGILMRWNCITQLYGTILLSQETSGVFLNYYLLMRYRLGQSHWSVNASFAVFSLCFAIYRLGFNTYGTIHYVLHYQQHIPSRVAAWQAHIIAVCLVLGALLQWFWGVIIVKKVRQVARGKEKVDAEPEAKASPVTVNGNGACNSPAVASSARRAL